MQTEVLPNSRRESPLKRQRDDERSASELDSLSPRTKRMRLADQYPLDLPASAAMSEGSRAGEGENLQQALTERLSSTGLDGTSSEHPSATQSSPKTKTGKGKRRQDWTGIGRPKASTPRERPADGETDSTKPRLPKRKVALLLGFCGTGCSGMQYQKEVTTIEGILFEALSKAGCVSEDNADDPVKVQLQRAARTDAGVHAAGNVVSLKMITQLPEVEDVIAHVNSFLPPQIRLWGYVRAQNSFHARLSCDSRVYEYLFPSYLLLPPKPGSKLALQNASDKPIWRETDPVGGSDSPSVHPFWKEVAGESDWESELKRKRKWRVPVEVLDRLRSLVKLYEGTHNFYNYTVGRDFKDRSNKRYLLSIQVRDPEVYGEMEWISVIFHGQSFMLHQIRKMISMAVLACRSDCPSNLILESYGPSRIRIPKAPALGLLLEEPCFGGYNTKVVASNQALDDSKAKGKAVSDADYREPVHFTSYREAINKFKVEQIYERLRAVEEETAEFDNWMRTMDSYKDYNLAYLNPKGVIPHEATYDPKTNAPPRTKNVTGDNPADQAVFDEDEAFEGDAAKLEEMEG